MKKGSQKRALITGVTGQDGSYLAEFLHDKGYKVYGLLRRISTDPFARIGDLHAKGGIELIYGNLRDLPTITNALKISKPDEIYNLAAQSHVGISFTCPDETFDINYKGVERLVSEAVRLNPKVRIYQASTSEMFGNTNPPQNEKSVFAPVSPYGVAKLHAHEKVVVPYREKGFFVCSGILFNHESPRRGKHFVTRKITHSLIKVKHGLQDVLTLGNLEAKRDWGFAGDYVEAMHMMLQENEAIDFVIASGEMHSVKEFVEIAASELGLEISWQGSGSDQIGKDQNGRVVVKVNPQFYRPLDISSRQGDIRKIKEELGWMPKTSFSELVSKMVRADLEKLIIK
jgi:GDPmannose 4,6-dehydratase